MNRGSGCIGSKGMEYSQTFSFFFKSQQLNAGQWFQPIFGFWKNICLLNIGFLLQFLRFLIASQFHFLLLIEDSNGIGRWCYFIWRFPVDSFHFCFYFFLVMIETMVLILIDFLFLGRGLWSA